MACAVLAGEIVREMGLLNYDPSGCAEVGTNSAASGDACVVVAEYDTPAQPPDQLHGNHRCTDHRCRRGRQSGLTYIKRPPVGSLLGHYDTDKHMLWLLKKASRITASGSAPTRSRSSASSRRIGPGDRASGAEAYPWAGDRLRQGQSRCFGIKMNHKEMSGAADLHVVSSPSAEATAPAEERATIGRGLTRRSTLPQNMHVRDGLSRQCSRPRSH
jgi:hypothetical protein